MSICACCRCVGISLIFLIASLLIICTTSLASPSTEWLFGDELTSQEHQLYDGYLLSALSTLKQSSWLLKDNPWSSNIFLAMQKEENSEREFKMALAYIPHTLDSSTPMSQSVSDPNGRICYVVEAACFFHPVAEEKRKQIVADTIIQLAERLKEEHFRTEDLWKHHQSHPVRIAIIKKGLKVMGNQTNDSRMENVLEKVAYRMGIPAAYEEDEWFNPPVYNILTLATLTPTPEPAGN